MESPSIQPQPYRVKPIWSPLALSWMSLLFTPIPALVMTAINYGRVGQTQRKKLWLIYTALIALVYCLIVFRFSMLSDSQSYFLRPLSVGFSIAIAWKLYLSQSKLFERHIQQGGKKASVWVPILASQLWLAMIFGVAFGSVFIIEARIKPKFEKAFALMEKENYKQAEAILTEIENDYPEEVNTKYNLAIIYAQTDRLSLAKQELQQILKLEPQNQDAKDFLEELQPMN